MSANRLNNRKAIGKACGEQQCYWGQVSTGELRIRWSVQTGRERKGIFRNQDPGSLRHFLCTLSHMHSEKEWMGGGTPDITAIMRV